MKQEVFTLLLLSEEGFGSNGWSILSLTSRGRCVLSQSLDGGSTSTAMEVTVGCLTNMGREIVSVIEAPGIESSGDVRRRYLFFTKST